MQHNFYHGDCLEEMDNIPDQSIDMVLADMPYGTTKCKWDIVIPLDKVWGHLKRVVKPSGAVVLFAGQPFTSVLICSNLKMFRYNYVWNKRKAANFLFGNKQPLKKTEDICVFYKKQPTYNTLKKLNPNGPQVAGRKGIGNTIHDHLPNAPERSMAGKQYESDMLLPDNILEFSKPHKPWHPTQKPVALLEYLIEVYTNPGDTVLDFTFGSCSTGIAALKTGRWFIGIEKDDDYFYRGTKEFDAVLTSGV